MPFNDRSDAGRRLANALATFQGEDPMVVALSGGGVPVGYEIAQGLDLPLDVLPVERLRPPGAPDRVLGAVGLDGARLLDQDLLEQLAIPRSQVADLIERAGERVATTERRHRTHLDPLEVTDRTVLLVDQGVYTGSAARLAARFLRMQNAQRVVLAVPTAPSAVLAALRDEVHGLVALTATEHQRSVATLYRSLPQVPLETERQLLQQVRSEPPSADRVPETAPAAVAPRVPEPPPDHR